MQKKANSGKRPSKTAIFYDDTFTLLERQDNKVNMDNYDYSALERELALQRILIQYLKEEQKKEGNSWMKSKRIWKNRKTIQNLTSC